MIGGHRLLPWPDNLTPTHRRCIEAVHEHGTHQAAADALGLSINTVHRALEKARRRAGVKTTAALLGRYLATKGTA